MILTSRSPFLLLSFQTSSGERAWFREGLIVVFGLQDDTLRIRFGTKHPAARKSPLKHRMLAVLIRSSGVLPTFYYVLTITRTSNLVLER